MRGHRRAKATALDEGGMVGGRAKALCVGGLSHDTKVRMVDLRKKTSAGWIWIIIWAARTINAGTGNRTIDRLDVANFLNIYSF